MKFLMWHSETLEVLVDINNDLCCLRDKKSGATLAEIPVTEIRSSEDVTLIIDTLVSMVVDKMDTAKESRNG